MRAQTFSAVLVMLTTLVGCATPPNISADEAAIRKVDSAMVTALNARDIETWLSFFAEDGVGPDDPSHAKRFWTAVEGGGKYRVYEQQMSAKLIDLTVEHYSNVSLTSTLGLRKLTVS